MELGRPAINSGGHGTMIEKFRPSRFSLPEFTNKQEYLYYLYNNLGFTNLEICISTVKGEDKVFSKWLKFSSLLEKSGEEWIKGAFNEAESRPYTRDEFIEASSHRTIMDIELMLDIDETEIFSSIKDKSVYIYQNLKRLGFSPHVSFTGNKSYHISVLLPELRSLTKKGRKFIKDILIEDFGGDPQKSSERCMIAMLGAIHYKSGKPKKKEEWGK